MSEHQTVRLGDGISQCIHCKEIDPDMWATCFSRPNPYQHEYDPPRSELTYPEKFPDGYFTPSMEHDEDWETIKRESTFEGEHGPEVVQFSGEEKIVSKAELTPMKWATPPPLTVHPATGLLQIAHQFSDYLPSTDHDESNVQAAINYMRHRGYISPEPPKPEPVVTHVYKDNTVTVHGLKFHSAQPIGPEDEGWDGNPHTSQFKVEFSTAGTGPSVELLKELYGMTMTQEQQRKAMGSRITNLRKEARQLNKAVIRRNQLIQRLYAKLEKKEEARKRWQKHAQAYENKYNAARTQLLRERCSESEWQQKFEQLQARYDSDMASAGKLPTAHGTSVQAARIEDLQADVKRLQTLVDQGNEFTMKQIDLKNEEIRELEEDVQHYQEKYEALQNRFRLVEGDSAWQALKVAQLKRKVKGLTKDLKKAVANKK